MRTRRTARGVLPRRGRDARRIRVFIADDPPALRLGLGSVFERHGFEVVGEAADGVNAVRLVRERCPDVAVLDVAMPLLNGVDAAREILRTVPGTRVMLITGVAGEAVVPEALRAGVHGVVAQTE